MPNLLVTASQVANSLSNLKAKYIKYLEALCSANGIDISTLKTEGDSHTTLEMYFGGLPVLVGLKYFSQLSTLRLFGQQITCLKPLGEVAPTLEELWVCEGVLKDLSGIENCVRLKRLYLYENSIEDPSCLSALLCLQNLDLSSNKIKKLGFLRTLRDLTNLSLANNKMRDSEIATASWPENIQHLDISSNCFSSNKCLFPLTMLSSLRSLHLDPVIKSLDVAPTLFFAWISHSFRYIETIDDDPISDCFVSTFRPMIDTIFAEKLGRIAKADEKFMKDTRIMEKHSSKVEVRLSCLAEALAVYRDAMQTKDAKKEIVKRVYEICMNNSKAVKNIKKNYNILSEYLRNMAKYRIACEMESCHTFPLRDGLPEEIAFITQTLNYSCSMKNNYEIIVKSCCVLCQVSKSETERLFILEKDSTDCLFSIRSILHLLDRYTRNDYMKHSVKIIRDFEIIRKQSKEKTIVYFIPLVSSKISTNRSGKTVEEEGVSTSSNDNLSWSDIRLVAVLAVEIQPIGQLTTDQIRYMDKFEESYNEQLKKLNDMNIKLDIKDERIHKKIDENIETSLDNMNNQQSKIRKVSDIMANINNLVGRATDEIIPFDWFSIRNPLEISIAYFDCRPFKETNDLLIRLTSLDLSDQKLTKLAGIQELVSLQYLSIRKNKITSLKKLNRLPNLKLLDASLNHFVKLESLPSTLLYVDIGYNRLQNMSFCQSIQNIRHLRVHRNQIKSMKGIEGCIHLETLFINENVIKDRCELELLKNLTKLTHLDISGNIISNMDGFRSRIMQSAPFLISLDRSIIPVEERHVNTSKQATRGLSLELIERICSEWKNKQEIMIRDQKIEQIILEKSQLEELMHIRLLDLSKNKLSSVREISSLNITNLVLNNNTIKTIGVNDGQLMPFTCLENLDLSNNSITNTNIVRLGLQHLLKLKQIDLSANGLSRFDCGLFDLPILESIDLSNNAIKTIIRRPLQVLTTLKLQNNRLTTLSPMTCPNLINLDISNNKLASCASLKPLCECKKLEILDCRNNTVTERRVYVDFIKTQVSSVRQLDDELMESETDLTKRRLSKANDILSINRRNSMVTSSMLSWFEKEEDETISDVQRSSSFLEPPRIGGMETTKTQKSQMKRIERGRKRTDEDVGFMLVGTKAVQHKKY